MILNIVMLSLTFKDSHCVSQSHNLDINNNYNKYTI